MTAPTLLWLRRDLRLGDHPALTAAVERGGPVIPVFIHDDSVAGLGAAPKWRMGEALRVFPVVEKELGTHRPGTCSDSRENHCPGVISHLSRNERWGRNCFDRRLLSERGEGRKTLKTVCPDGL